MTLSIETATLFLECTSTKIIKTAAWLTTKLVEEKVKLDAGDSMCISSSMVESIIWAMERKCDSEIRSLTAGIKRR